MPSYACQLIRQHKIFAEFMLFNLQNSQILVLENFALYFLNFYLLKLGKTDYNMERYLSSNPG